MRRAVCNSTPAYRNVVTSEDSAVQPAGLFVEPGAKGATFAGHVKAAVTVPIWPLRAPAETARAGIVKGRAPAAKRRPRI